MSAKIFAFQQTFVHEVVSANFEKNKSINESNKKAIQKSRNIKIPDPKRTTNKLNKINPQKKTFLGRRYPKSEP